MTIKEVLYKYICQDFCMMRGRCTRKATCPTMEEMEDELKEADKG